MATTQERVDVVRKHGLLDISLKLLRLHPKVQIEFCLSVLHTLACIQPNQAKAEKFLSGICDQLMHFRKPELIPTPCSVCGGDVLVKQEDVEEIHVCLTCQGVVKPPPKNLNNKRR